MVISIVMRKAAVKDRGQWESRLAQAMAALKQVLAQQRGFVSVQYLWGADNDGEMAQITTWETLDDCLSYVREGGAATVAAYEDGALPTAPHPDGAWLRKTFELVEGLS